MGGNREINCRHQSEYETEKREKNDESRFSSHAFFKFLPCGCEARTHRRVIPLREHAQLSHDAARPAAAPYQLTRLLRLADCCRSLWKFETHFAVHEFQISGEGASTFRNEALEKIGLP